MWRGKSAAGLFLFVCIHMCMCMHVCGSVWVCVGTYRNLSYVTPLPLLSLALKAYGFYSNDILHSCKVNRLMSIWYFWLGITSGINTCSWELFCIYEVLFISWHITAYKKKTRKMTGLSLVWLYINYQLLCTDYYLFIKY